MDEFKKELIELMKKHNIEIGASDKYDGNDDYCGTDYYFAKIGGSYYDRISIDELE